MLVVRKCYSLALWVTSPKDKMADIFYHLAVLVRFDFCRSPVKWRTIKEPKYRILFEAAFFSVELGFSTSVDEIWSIFSP